MRKTLTILLALIGVCGCDPESKHEIVVDKLIPKSEMNVLWVTYSEPYTLATKSGKSRLSRIVRGGAYYRLDLGKITLNPSVVEDGGKVAVTLPGLRIEPMPDSMKSESFRPKTDPLVADNGYKKLQEALPEYDKKKIEKGCAKAEYKKIAKEQAERILRDMLEPAVKVEFRWKDE